MNRPVPRRDAPDDPLREPFVQVRRGLLDLHKTLIDAERAAAERRDGPMSSGQFLQALLQEPAFAWLRPFSALLVEIDELLATREPLSRPQVDAYLARIRGLVAPEAESDARRYEHVRDRDPDVLVAHVELVRRMADFRPDADRG